MSRFRLINDTALALKAFAETGSRTLLMASRQLSEADVHEWQRAFEEASVSLDRRERQIEQAFSIIEKDLILLGCTAVDDQLQSGVSDAVSSIIAANVTVVVLTGDKMETAVTIGRASGIVGVDDALVYVDGLKAQRNRSVCSKMLKSLAEKMRKDLDAKKTCALVVSGIAMEFCMRYDLDCFLEIVSLCSTVICCRATPGHKAAIVYAVRKKLNKICCAIGDGANDVPMLMRANVGVGLTGKEGTQAARSADFVLHRFRHLKRLLFVHGRYSYLRSSVTVLHSFYKNMVS